MKETSTNFFWRRRHYFCWDEGETLLNNAMKHLANIFPGYEFIRTWIMKNVGLREPNPKKATGSVFSDKDFKRVGKTPKTLKPMWFSERRVNIQ